MAAAVVVFIVIVLAAVHMLGGLFHYANHRARGRRVNFGWSMRRGWWGSVRFLGGSYYRHI